MSMYNSSYRMTKLLPTRKAINLASAFFGIGSILFIYCLMSFNSQDTVRLSSEHKLRIETVKGLETQTRQFPAKVPINEDEQRETGAQMEQFFKEIMAQEGPVHVKEDTCSCSPTDRERLWRRYGDYRDYDLNDEMPEIPAPKTDCKQYHEPIDLVLTWVNGTDPEFLRKLHDYEPDNASETDASRFKDMNQLKYAIRSFQKYAPWIRDTILVTNGQVPVWLNTDHPNVRVVTHQEIFDNPISELPTFSSPAIEINMHKIPGLSNRFIYANDDYFLMRPICPDSFLTPNDEIILYPKEYPTHWTPYGSRKKYKYKCDCPEDLYGNGKCDNIKECNKFECFWDGHDCDDKEPKDNYYRDNRPSYHQSVDYTQLVLDRMFYGEGNGVDNRTWNSHMPMMHDKRIIEKIWEDFPAEAEFTSSHTRRKKTDLQFQILNIYYTKESPRNKDYDKFPYFKHVIAGEDTPKSQDELVGYYALKKNWRTVVKRLNEARRTQKIFNCINDDLKHDGSKNAMASYFFLEQFYEEYFPDQTPMEKFNYYPHDLYADLL